MNNSKIRIGIICPSEIAFRRFLPSLIEVEDIEYIGVAYPTPEEWAENSKLDNSVVKIIDNEHEKAKKFQAGFGGKIFNGYQTLIDSPEIDAVYLPLPPALHSKWAQRAITAGKHAYVEKPFSTSVQDTLNLINLAKNNNIALHENYMFVFHKQLEEISHIISTGELGTVRQYRVNFGFPRRAKNDFRYNKALGGGSLLDAGGYCIRLGSYLLGDSAELVYANLKNEPEYEVDIFGSGVMKNDEGVTVHLSFGMDCDYKCELEAWGSSATLTTDRILTAPDGFIPRLVLKKNQTYVEKELSPDCAFRNSIRRFLQCVHEPIIREENYEIIKRQALFIDKFIKLAK